jgi:hypothetical protein
MDGMEVEEKKEERLEAKGSGVWGNNVKKSLKKEGSLQGPLHRVERSVSLVVAPKREPYRIGSTLKPESTRDGDGDTKHSPCHDTQLD